MTATHDEPGVKAGVRFIDEAGRWAMPLRPGGRTAVAAMSVAQPVASDQDVLARRYRLEELIGSGGMADVYRARDLWSGQLVAVKTPRTHVCDEPGVRARFSREGRILARLHHRSIVGLLDCGEDLVPAREPRPYIVLELVNGSTVRALLNPRTPLAVRDACQITADVLSGLGHAHRHGIVHGDVSPANVMVCADGHAKLLDFGGARHLGDPEMPTPDGIARTPGYMAPEQALGGTAGTAADIYGSGCLLYALLTGRPPFHGDPIALAYQHVHEAPRPPAAIRSAIPQQLEDVVLRAIAKAPSARHPDPGSFRRDLFAAMRPSREVAS